MDIRQCTANYHRCTVRQVDSTLVMTSSSTGEMEHFMDIHMPIVAF